MESSETNVRLKHILTIMGYFCFVYALLDTVLNTAVQYCMMLGAEIREDFLFRIAMMFVAITVLIVSKRILDFFLNYDYKWPVHFSVQCENMGILKFIGFLLLIFLMSPLLLSPLVLFGVYHLQEVIEFFVSSTRGFIGGFIYYVFNYFITVIVFWILVKFSIYQLKVTNKHAY